MCPTIQAPVLTQQRTVSGIQTISLMQPSIQRTQQTFGLPKEPIQQEQPLLVQPILPIDDTLPIGIGIPINVPIPNTENFIEPVQVGVPTINNDPGVVEPTISVGAGKLVRVLNGRTHLAR